jgi:alkylation response protein AidB-like acyl-CoA dehydrogenase
MNFDLSEEQQILRDSARSFIAKECPSTFVRDMARNDMGYSPDLWNKMAELGWLGLLIPEEYGGSGMSFLDLSVLLYEMGYGLMPGPYFPTAVCGVISLMEGGSDKQKRELLPEIARGKLILTLAWNEEGGTYLPEGINMKAKRGGDGWVLSGTKLFVPYAHIADKIILAARTGRPGPGGEGGISLFIVNRDSTGLKVDLLRTIADDKQCEVILEGVKVNREDLLGGLNRGWQILINVLKKSAVAKCAEMSGGAQKVMEMVVAHAKERIQFGRPIGSFQAVQHHCANILTYVDTIRFISFEAAWRISTGLPFDKEASMCKAWVSDSYRRLVAISHQVMGGMGFMEEHDLQLYFKHAKASELLFGDGDFHRELLAREMGL